MVDAAGFLVRNRMSLDETLAMSDNAADEQLAVDAESRKKTRDLEGTLYDGDPSQELDNPKHEQFLRVYVDKGVGHVAYRVAISDGCTRKAASEQASRLLRAPKLQARLRWLLAEKRRAIEEKDKGKAGGLSRADLIQHLEAMVTGASNYSDRIQAIKELNRLKSAQGGSRRAPDPAFLCQFFREAAAQGKDPEELARQAALERRGEPAGDEETPPAMDGPAVDPGEAGEGENEDVATP